MGRLADALLLAPGLYLRSKRPAAQSGMTPAASVSIAGPAWRATRVDPDVALRGE
jgi:hypothetical protein